MSCSRVEEREWKIVDVTLMPRENAGLSR
jgi:hypothetical protein